MISSRLRQHLDEHFENRIAGSIQENMTYK